MRHIKLIAFGQTALVNLLHLGAFVLICFGVGAALTLSSPWLAFAGALGLIAATALTAFSYNYFTNHISSSLSEIACRALCKDGDKLKSLQKASEIITLKNQLIKERKSLYQNADQAGNRELYSLAGVALGLICNLAFVMVYIGAIITTAPVSVPLIGLGVSGGITALSATAGMGFNAYNKVTNQQADYKHDLIQSANRKLDSIAANKEFSKSEEKNISEPSRIASQEPTLIEKLTKSSDSFAQSHLLRQEKASAALGRG